MNRARIEAPVSATQWVVGQVMTATAIRDDGGPYPTDGETKEHYYARVQVWADSRGYLINWVDGYPYFAGYGSGTGTILGMNPMLALGLAGLGLVIMKKRKK